MKEVTNSLKSMEAALTDKSDYNKSLSEKRGNISKTKIIMGEHIPQNITKQSEQTSGSLCTELKEATFNTQELAILQEMNSAENLENSTEILELAKIQNKCSFVNAASITNPEKAQKFFTDLGIVNLNIYFDPNFSLVKLFNMRGVPTSILINKNGQEFGRVIGEVDFFDKSFVELLKKYL